MSSASITEVIRSMFEQIPFCRMLDMKFIGGEKDHITVMIPFQPGLLGDARRPALHGGVVSTLLDTVGGAVAYTRLNPKDDRISTVDLRVDYLLPATTEDLYAEGRVARSGNRIIVTRMIAYHRNPRRVVAEGTGVYNVRRGDDQEA